ncbi:MAG TPA: formate/nitrite transporter family protein [Gemmatimonadaceae bacterium]|nr:formate/nitrite transporter family protein [Gemmatimonadaceae bacterium]
MKEVVDETIAAEREAGPSEPSVGTRFSAKEIHENVRHAAEEEMDRPAPALWFSSLAAGMAMTFSFMAAAYATTLVPTRFAAAAAAAAYPLGFIFVVLARNQLFTENTLEPVIPLLTRLNRATLFRVLRLWVIVLAGNLIGTLAIALILAHTDVVNTELDTALLSFAAKGIAGGFWFTFYRAIFAGWLIALLAWLVASTRATGAQIVLIWLTTAPISAFGFRHSIAGSSEAFYLAASGGTSWWQSIGSFVIPAILGNIVGGVILVAIFNHGQVAAEIDEEGRQEA